MLKLFTAPDGITQVCRSILTPLLEQLKDCLPAPAAALLTAEMLYPEYCRAWAEQFKTPENFGAPLLNALLEIETLALPENKTLLDDALGKLPPGYVINRNMPPLHQCTHLWLMARNTPGVSWPLPRISVSQPSPVTQTSESAVSQASEPANHRTDEAPLPQLTSPDLNPEPPAPAPETDPQVFLRLARLPIARYDRVRRAEAKALGLRLATLDREVALCRAQLDDEAEANAIKFPPIEPWPEPVIGAEVLLKVSDRFTRYLALPDGAATVFSLWTPATHAVNAFRQTPRLNLYSTIHGCGKSTAMDVLATLVPRPFSAENIRAAVLFRVVDQRQPTLLLDELDTYLHQAEELRGLLNAGHKPGACVYRCEGGDVRGFKAFAAAALAGIGSLPPTLHDRSILIPLAKAEPGQLAARFDSHHTEVEQILCRQLARWTKDHFAELAACDPVLPPSAYNRLADNWRPLFAIAQVAGGPWPDLVKDAFEKLTAQPHPELDLNAALLFDIRLIFEQSGADRLFSSTLVERLSLLPDRPWSAVNNGNKPLTVNRLARRLAALGIHTNTIRIGPLRAKGYLLSDFPRVIQPPA